MTIRVAISHKTTYSVDKLVGLSPHVIRLRPAPHSRTPVSSYSLNIYPEEHFINWQQDPFGNFLARVVFPEKTDRLQIDVEVIADLASYNPFDFFIEEYAEKYPFHYTDDLSHQLSPYLVKCDDSDLLNDWLKKVPAGKMQTNDFLVWINQVLCDEIDYSLRFDPGVQTPAETLKLKKGSCRDFAWLLAQLLRHCGLATRFVSGYLVQLAPDQESLDGPSGPKEDFTDLHAWCEVYLPGAGWVGLDATSGLFASEGHIPLSCTPEPQSAAPVEGAVDPCEVSFSYSNTVTRVHETPRVTKPYSEAQWQAIDVLGEAVDQQLAQDDVRLTMGGEPTFVSIDDMESAQWNTAALGADKLS
ncbi:transglutaminase family protein, partial [bacterium]|nr:transglutaminase family protein [bacterium]